MPRVHHWLALAVMTGMASWSHAADPAAAPAPFLIGNHSIVSPTPLTPEMHPGYRVVAPIIVNGYLVYPTDQYNHTLPNKKPKNGPVHLWWDYVRSPQHQAEPDGALTPVGNASFWTEFKFFYGSSRQFFGSPESAPVQRQFFNPELEPGYLLRAWHPKKYGRVQ
jgi:hypothetical protein